MFLPLAGQALLAAAVPGGLLVWNMHMGQEIQLAQRDRERLEAFADAASVAATAGKPLDQLVPELDLRDPQRLGGRVQLVRPDGAPISGPTSTEPPRAERPVKVGGQTVALARIVREPNLTDDDRRYLAAQYLGIGAIITGLFVLLLVTAYEFARRWSKPQQELYRLSREVVHGDHDIDFDERGPSEVVATMRNLRRIASQFSRLETARRTWLVSIADELKRPTASLSTHLDALAAAQIPIDAELTAGLEDDQRRLSQMAEDLSAVALADLGRLPVNFNQVDPRALIHNAIHDHSKRALANGVRLETSTLPGYTILVKWDGARIEQLFGALIENSLRYTPRGGQIVLGLESSRDAWRLIIDDSAPGIDVMLAQRLFEPFFRSSDRPEDSAAASGLGLATARAIVEAHHGRIEASRSPIGGLRVTVILPTEPPRA
ncbi:ATP-binding protein [Sphingomonas sp. LB-2]|uniref:sensor histidine kinase n=1 Tax=Sphingomonas caeni TaxID=2984949 RepID=UPI002231ED65|nr:ATP-binding protein [Sphingomonas caeni]MCW3847704.1 ATP-binding protein [Sphingomonas caeni]